MEALTDEEAFALGVRAVKAGLHPEIGMGTVMRDYAAEDCGVIDGIHDNSQPINTTRGRCGVFGEGGIVPDLRDPGTKGHAVAQLRERTGDSGFTTAYDEFRPGMAGEWWVSCRATLAALVDQNGPYPTEEEAIVAAFEATKETP